MTTTREAQLEAALIEIDNAPGSDHWVPQFQHVKDIAAAALALPPDTHSAGYVEGLGKIDGQVFTAAKDMGSRGRENPEWAFIDYEANRMSFGRWAKCGDNPAPYIRADLVIDALAARPAPQPAAMKIEPLGAAFDAAIFSDVESLYETDGIPQPAADTRVVTVDVLTDLADFLDRLSENYSPFSTADEKAVALRAIIGTATPAPSDKIAEAARVLLGSMPKPGVLMKDMSYQQRALKILNKGGRGALYTLAGLCK